MMTIDLNLDAGESLEMLNNGTEAQLYGLVSSVNIACGGHTGDEASMRIAVKLATARNLAIGAHPSYPDRASFGRRHLEIDSADLTASLIQQIKALAQIVHAEGSRLTHVKPHGALYNVAADDESTAMAVIEATQAFDANLPIIGLAGSKFEVWCKEKGVGFIAEGFVDRAYESDGRLRKRSEPGALIEDPYLAAAQAMSILTASTLKVQTLCIHGDSPNALENARIVRAKLESSKVKIQAVKT